MSAWLADPWHCFALIGWWFMANDAWEYRRAEFSDANRAVTVVIGPPILFGFAWLWSWAVGP